EISKLKFEISNGCNCKWESTHAAFKLSQKLWRILIRVNSWNSWPVSKTATNSTNSHEKRPTYGVMSQASVQIQQPRDFLFLRPVASIVSVWVPGCRPVLW